MRIVSLALSLAVFGGAVLAQSNTAPPQRCTLTVAQAPAIRGFKLGTTVEQIKTRFPNIKIGKPDDLGYVYGAVVEAVSVPEAEKPNFDNIKYVVLEFLDERLTSIQILYGDSATWQNSGQLVPLVSAKYGLSGEWLDGNLRCNGFTVGVQAGGRSASLGMNDLSVRETLRQRRAAKEEAERRAFKP